VLERQDDINSEVARGDKANIELLRQMRKQQSEAVESWLALSADKAERKRAVAAEHKELKLRESALREAGWKPKSGKVKAKKVKGPTLKTRQANIEKVNESLLGAGDDSTFEAFLESCGLGLN
jgi:hypothetical protein